VNAVVILSGVEDDVQAIDAGGYGVFINEGTLHVQGDTRLPGCRLEPSGTTWVHDHWLELSGSGAQAVMNWTVNLVDGDLVLPLVSSNTYTFGSSFRLEGSGYFVIQAAADDVLLQGYISSSVAVGVTSGFTLFSSSHVSMCADTDVPCNCPTGSERSSCQMVPVEDDTVATSQGGGIRGEWFCSCRYSPSSDCQSIAVVDKVCFSRCVGSQTHAITSVMCSLRF
jgi:hypothetical protein